MPRPQDFRAKSDRNDPEAGQDYGDDAGAPHQGHHDPLPWPHAVSVLAGCRDVEEESYGDAYAQKQKVLPSGDKDREHLEEDCEDDLQKIEDNYDEALQELEDEFGDLLDDIDDEDE